MRISVKFKLLPIIVIGIVLLTGVFYYTFTSAMEKNLNAATQYEIDISREVFYNLEENDVKMLSSTLEAILANKELKEKYLKNNREELYNYGQPLFSQLKQEFGITHFYFHLPNGTNFVRLHDKTKFGDKITRKTFEKSVQSNGFGTGLELGKTAFALRVVHPYYNGSNLIGYVELGEEIDHFLKDMKKQTGNEYGIFIKKELINHADWKSIREARGLKDNYDDLQNFVMIDTTSESLGSLFVKDESALMDEVGEKHKEETDVINKFQAGPNTYVSGGFPLHDAAGKDVGTVAFVMDITPIENSAKQNSRFVLITAIVAAILISIIVVLLVNQYILKPLDNIVDATTRVAGGDFSAEVKAQSNDEIGDLAVMIEGFKKILVGTAKDLEEAQRKA